MLISSEGILSTAQYNLRQSAERIGIDKEILNKLTAPKEKTEFRLSPVLSSGEIANIEAYIVRYNDILGPSKGGIRMTESVSLEEVVGLAMEMTWKTALVEVPFGGGKSGIRFDPSSVSQKDKEIIIRSFARAAKRHFGPEIYIPAPDMGTNEADMGYIRDCISYSEGTSITRGCFVTGKPVILGGIPSRKEATGKGVVYTILSACEALELDVKDLKVVVQGFGNVGAAAALELFRNGAKIIAVSDISGGLVDRKGINIEQLIEYTGSKGDIKGFAGADAVSRESIFDIESDCLIPAAAGSQITENVARRLKTKIIAEGANAPTLPDADEILNDKDIFIIPDILSNAGGVFVSYLEYVQETQHEQKSISNVNERLSERMKKCFRKVYDYSRDNNVYMRQAAMDIAVKRVVDGIKARGFLP
jgi:glutamate dehydrogenase/leucine dehydrogenase